MAVVVTAFGLAAGYLSWRAVEAIATTNAMRRLEIEIAGTPRAASVTFDCGEPT